MRTVIYIGLTAIAFAINPEWLGEAPVKFFSTILMFAIIMDIWEFFSIGDKES